MSCHYVIVCEDDSWCVHAASHTIDPAALRGKHCLWCCEIGTENMAGLFGQQLSRIQFNLLSNNIMIRSFNVNICICSNYKPMCQLSNPEGYIDGLVQERCNSIANTMELPLSCTNPSIYEINQYWTTTNHNKNLEMCTIHRMLFTWMG